MTHAAFTPPLCSSRIFVAPSLHELCMQRNERDTNTRLNGTRPVQQTTLAAKASVARSHGAKMLLIIGDPTHKTDDAPYALFGSDPDAEDHVIPVLRIRRAEAQPLVDA